MTSTYKLRSSLTSSLSLPISSLSIVQCVFVALCLRATFAFPCYSSPFRVHALHSLDCLNSHFRRRLFWRSRTCVSSSVALSLSPLVFCFRGRWFKDKKRRRREYTGCRLGFRPLLLSWGYQLLRMLLSNSLSVSFVYSVFFGLFGFVTVGCRFYVFISFERGCFFYFLIILIEALTQLVN